MIYLDHNATTPVLPEVADAMWPFLTEQWGNPSSTYRFGATSKLAVNTARERVAALIGARPEELIFTSGATEANNTAIHSALATQPTKRHIITSKAEHSSVLGYCEVLEARGITVTYLDVDRDGRLDCADLSAAIRPDTALVSMMWANNETGVISPVQQIAAICQERRVRFHCDAVQAVGKTPVHFQDLPIDYLTLSGHKLGAPKGIGALVVREGINHQPLLVGGKQETGRRGGTEPVPSIVGFGVASAAVARRGVAVWQPIVALRDSVERQLRATVPGFRCHGAGATRLPNTTNFGIPGVDSDGLVTFLDSRGFCVSSGSACLENALTPSHVIMAMTGSHEAASEALRVSLGLDTNADQIGRLVALIAEFAVISRQSPTA